MIGGGKDSYGTCEDEEIGRNAEADHLRRGHVV